MNADLFRTEVLQRHTGMELGDALQWEPPRARVLLFFLGGVFMLLLAFAALAPVSRSEVVRGVITADGGPGKLHVPAAGQVDQVLVREGQLVARGEALLTLTPAAYAAAGPLSHRFVAEALAQQLGVLQSQLELLRTREARDRDDVARRRQALQQALALQAQEQALVQQRLTLAGEALQRSATLLERRLVAPASHAQALEVQVSARQAVVAQELARGQLQEALLALEQEARQVAMDLTAETLRLELAMSQLQVQQQEQARQAQVTLRAPVSGRVAGLVVKAGMAVDPARPVLSLLPESSDLVARLFVPSRATGSLQAGQVVQLVYDAYPQSIHGGFPARISSVSETTVDPREYLLPFDTSEPVFLVQAVLELDSMPANLRAGMLFTAHVQTGRESLLARITAPLRRLESLL